MNFFPVSNSTLSPVHIAHFLADHYDMGGTASASILKTGISDTYLVEGSRGKFIFRVYSLGWRTEKEITAELQLLHLLHDNDVPVSYPVADKNARYIQQLQAPEGVRYAVLFSFAKGEKLLQIPEHLHYKIGQIMARMHQLTLHLELDRIVYTPKVLLQDSMEQLKKFLPAATEEMAYMQALQGYLLQVFSQIGEVGLRKGVVHLDIWFDNLVIDSDSVTIFDFDFCGNGMLLLDIAYYVLQLYSTEKDDTEFKRKYDQFFNGYESVTSISAAEKDLLPAAAVSLYFFYLGVQCSRYDNWSNNFLNEIYLKRFINLLIKKWVDHYKLPVNVSV